MKARVDRLVLTPKLHGTADLTSHAPSETTNNQASTRDTMAWAYYVTPAALQAELQDAHESALPSELKDMKDGGGRDQTNVIEKGSKSIHHDHHHHGHAATPPREAMDVPPQYVPSFCVLYC